MNGYIACCFFLIVVSLFRQRIAKRYFSKVIFFTSRSVEHLIFRDGNIKHRDIDRVFDSIPSYWNVFFDISIWSPPSIDEIKDNVDKIIKGGNDE